MSRKDDKSTKRKYKSVEDVKKHREELSKKFGGNLPTNLHDYFEEQIRQQKLGEKLKSARSKKYTHSVEERVEFVNKKNEEFWQNNKTELVKRKRTTANPRFDEPLRATEQIGMERELTDLEEATIRQLCEEDLELFAVRYFPHYLKKPSSRLHKYLYRTLARELNKKNRKEGIKLAIAAPRFNAKSSIVSGIFPIWCLCYDKKRFILIVSDTASQAEDFLSDIKRELEFNDKLKQDFPHVCQKGPIWRVNEIVTGNEIKMIALGTGNKVRGRKFGVHRPDLVVCDDLENSEMVRSETTRDHVRFQWFDKDLMFAGGESGTATDFLVVGTVLGKDSLLNALLDPNDYPEWDRIRFRAVEKFSNSNLWDRWAEIYKNRFDEDRKETAYKFFQDNQISMLAGTEILWPEGDPYYELMVWKYTKPSAFASEKQNDPFDPTKILVTMKQLHWEDFYADTKISKILRRGYYFGALDPSLGKKGGDYSAIMTVCRDPKTGYIFVVSMYIKRMSVDDQILAILAHHEKYKYKGFAVETNAFQQVVADALRKKSRETGLYVPLTEVQHYIDKKLRFEGVIPFITDGTVVFDKKKHSRNQMYNMGIEQITTFTGEDDRHDDAVDALVMAFEVAKKPKFRRITRQTR